MLIRTGLVLMLCGLSGYGWADGDAAVTFSGSGKKPIEVRDKSGEVTEVIGQSSLQLNQIPEEAAAREQAYREEMQLRAEALAAERENQRAEEAARAKEVAKAAELAAAASAAEAAKAAEEIDPTPRKVRRKTVRGTRLIATEPVDPQLRTPENTGVKEVAPEQP